MSSNIKVIVETSKQAYEIVRFKSYEIEITLDIPADHFNIEFGNPTGEYSNLFDIGDKVKVYKEEEEILSGIIDDIDDRDEEGATITIDGRDTSLLFLDNDAIPTTLYNKDLLGLAKHFGDFYGIKNYDIEPGKKISKLPINSGEVEWDILDREARLQGKRVWMGAQDTLSIKTINYKQGRAYTFERGSTIPWRIPIESAQRKRSGADRKSEIWVNSYNKKSILYKAKDTDLINRGVHRRRIIENPELKTQKQIETKAKESLAQSKVGAWEYIASIHGKYLVLPNKIAHVKDPLYGIDEELFIVGVTYLLGESGSKTLVRMRKKGEAI